MYLNIIFIIFYAIIFSYFCKKQFDVFSYLFLSSSVYFIPALFGHVSDGTLPLILIPISTQLYFFYFAYFLGLVSFSIYSDRQKIAAIFKIRSNCVNGFISLRSDKLLKLLKITRVITASSLIIGFVSMGEHFYTFDKQQFLDNQSNWIVIWQSASVLYVILSFSQQKKIDIFIGIIYCIIDLYIGYRGVTVFSIFSVLALHAMVNKSKRSVFITISLYLFISFIFLSIYKIIILFIKMKDIHTGIDKFFEEEIFYYSIYSNEFFSQAAIFNSVIQNDFTIPVEHFLSILKVFLPGLNVYIWGKSNGFNDYFQSVLFPHVSWGMASNIWAEQYALFGWIWLSVFTLLFFALSFFLNNKAQTYSCMGKKENLVLLIFLLVSSTFLMHRNDIAYQLVLFRNNLFLWMIIVCLSKITINSPRR